MDLIGALRTTGAIRDFTDEPVDDAALVRILETARFAPSGGNAQGWRVVVIQDPVQRRRLGDIYQAGWYDYVAMKRAGLRPWAPTNDPGAEQQAIRSAPLVAAEGAAAPGFAEHFADTPALLVLLGDLSAFAAVDRDLDRYSFAGGASVYPFAWSILLAARAEGLGGVITTMTVRDEAEVLTLLGAEPPLSLAAVIALGHPVHQPQRLRRGAVSSFTTVDRVDGRAFG